MRPKRLMALVLALLVLTGLLTAAAYAEQAKTCGIAAQTVSGAPGEPVTLAVEITENPGFTNLGVALDFDPTQLELVSLNLADDQQAPYLCGSSAARNPAWNPAQDDNAKNNPAFDQSRTYPYVVCAAEPGVRENGTLFTATFRVLEGAAEPIAVTPVVSYIRNNEAVFSVFESVQATVQPGGIQLSTPITGVTLDRETLTLLVGREAQLTASLEPQGAEAEILWTSSADTVVTVEQGRLTAKAPGQAEITAAVGDKIARCTVTVALAGDLDLDGELALPDVMSILDRYNKSSFTPEELPLVDLNENGEADLPDIMDILSMYNSITG